MVRDIEKLRTRSEFRLGPRHLALIVGAAAVGAGLLFALGNAVAGRGKDAPGEARPDPLAALASPTAGSTQADDPAAPPEGANAANGSASATAVPEIEPLRLTFHERLGSTTAAAAGADDAMAPLPIDEPVATVPAATPSAGTARHNIALVAPAQQAPGPVPSAPALVAIAPMPVEAPAAPTAQPLPPGNPNPVFVEEPTPPMAQPGEQGVFTLQVASYPTQDEAVAFMNELRQKGHESFLVRATDGDRGTIWRVRVGPFHSQRDAERYRRTFERSERIPTFVVRRQLPVADQS